MSGLKNAQPVQNGNSVLKTRVCTIQFGGLIAVNCLDMNVQSGEIYGLIGPNGAGKTTIFNLLTGVYKPTSGEIFFQGQRIDGLKPYEISRRGVSRTFQNIRLFPSMSVLENVMTACHRHARQSIVDAVFRLPRFVRDEREHRDLPRPRPRRGRLDGIGREHRQARGAPAPGGAHRARGARRAAPARRARRGRARPRPPVRGRSGSPARSAPLYRPGLIVGRARARRAKGVIR